MRDELPVDGYGSGSERLGKDHLRMPDFTEEQLGDVDLMHYEAERARRRTGEVGEVARRKSSGIDRFFEWLLNLRFPTTLQVQTLWQAQVP